MDEVDIDNVEDINELEARLYAQIHHDTADEAKTNSELQLLENRGKNNDGITNENDADTHNSFKEPSKRYWLSGERSVKQLKKDQSLHLKHRFIRNPFKASSDSYEQRININSCPNSSRNQPQHGKQQRSLSNLSQSNEHDRIAQNIKPPIENITSATLTSKTDSQEFTTSSPFNENKKNKTTKVDQNTTKQKLPANKSNLKLNPVADWIKRKKNQINKKFDNKSNNNVNAKNSKNSSINIKQGLFARQQQKLLKAKRIEEKRQRSKKARNLAAGIANNLTPTEIIYLNSDNESDSSDVIMIPTGPLPTYIVDDSGDEGHKDEINLIVEHEENALDSADVQMSSKTACFIKPQEIGTQSLAAVDGIEKRVENSSRCTSPCSLQSSDDFIGQKDRSRLLAGASGMADDEDLLVLTSDINSLLEVSNISKQADRQVNLGKEKNPIDSSIKQVQAENVEAANDSLEFAAPKTTNQQSRPNNYRVDQGQFKALDVYESESDITDTVYSKGAHKQKPTVIRQIDTSSDEAEDISICSQRTKRLRKRRASSSNKESDRNNTNFATSSDNEEIDEDVEDDNEVLRTSIPFIAKGPAVERYKAQRRSRTLYSCSPNIRKRKSADKRTATGHMSDTEFIATLNNLAQGQEGEQKDQDLEEAEESETENTPTAREIAEKILAQHKVNEKNDQPPARDDDVALPQDILNELDKVFETIDQLDRQNLNQLSMNDDTVQVSDSSDSDREKHLIYKSSPNEDAQIIVYSPNNSQTQKSATNTRAENGSPIYNVIYSRGQRKPGGIGWNDEMRKFYNESWNGEHFILNKVLQKMNPDRRLWKIYTEDRFNIKTNKRTNLKCTNCCEYGHMRSKCRRPRKPMICYMCGDSGHYEPRCPNTICLRCGNKTQVFTKICNACSYQNRLTCPICKIRGHSLDYCPDKWRRYHSTTEANSQPNSSIRYNPRKYCCICGARGHISDSCRSAVRFSEYPAISSTIKSHQKSYNDVVVKAPFNGIALNLMYEPCQEYQFDLAALTTLDKYYGRFLKSVGMDHLFKRKRQMDTASLEMSDTNAKKAKRLSKKYEPNPYSKAGTAIQKNIEPIENAPNQVQEITESGNSDQQDNENRHEKDIINIEENSDNEVELIDCTVEADNLENTQLNTTIELPNEAAEHHVENFKSPKNVTSTSLAEESITTSQGESALTLDSDSNYSFSEHFDTTEKSVNGTTLANTPTSAKTLNEQNKNCLAPVSSRPKARKMETLPDYIPLIDSTASQNEQHNDYDNSTVGISSRFIAADSGDDEIEENRRNLSPLPELPCEAKIYLTHFHSKYLLSPTGNAFLVKASRAHNLKARLDFTSVGHVLVIFGLPTNQDKFQRELLLKYRELEDERNQKQIQSNLNVPKRTYVLIRFLRDNITQLMNNLGNVNYLLKRLQFLERQQTKTGYKLAEKVRRSLNMILVGQAGLQDGTMHLDKLLLCLKTLLNDVRSEIAPAELRSEITDHWKFIFSAYRYENYQKLVDTYNKLLSKNRMPQLNIDPLLLGQKVLDTHFSEEQTHKLDQAKTPTLTNATNTNTVIADKQIVPNPLNQKNTKPLKRKQNADNNTNAPNTNTNTKPKPTSTSTARSNYNNNSSKVKTKSTSTPVMSNKSTTLLETTASSGTSETANKAKQSTNTTNPAVTTTTTNANETSKKQPQKTCPPPPPFKNPEQRSTVSTTIQKVTDKWKSTCDTLLTEISSEKTIIYKNCAGDKVLDSKLPSVFWSRESMRYLDDCIGLASARPEVKEKLQRVQQKSKNGQLSYNDYLAVIKLHTALNGK